MLLVGGAGRNSGKTRLSCALIQRFRERHHVVGLKVTAIREGPCPRGKDSCGVCTSLEGDYAITEEHGDPPGKDTSLMVAAGAQQVFWMRVMRARMAQGLQALIRRIGPDAVCICESNSLRHVVQPGLFLIVKHRDADKMKRSSREVLHLADRVVLSDGQGFDVSPDDFALKDGRWVLG
jgi:molybdopterin-guanine dinucleotide biosynthesis protein